MLRSWVKLTVQDEYGTEMLLCMTGQGNPDLMDITDGLILKAEFDSEL